MRNLESNRPLALLICLLILAGLNTSCSLKQRAVNAMAEVLSESEAVYLSDDDPELVAEALPFNLKTIESLLESSPEHRGLLLSATTGFTFYAYGFVEPQADLIEDEDFEAAEEIRHRAARLYQRAYHYGLRGLELNHPGFGDLLPIEPDKTVAGLEADDAQLAVWTAAALGGVIGVSKDDPEATADIAVVGALLNRALELDPDFQDGLIYELLVMYEAQRVGGSMDKMKAYYQRALELSHGARCSTWLVWAQSVSVPEQNRREFEELIEKVLAFDVNTDKKSRLLNILAQRRASWLQSQVDELFLEGGDP